MTHGQQTTLCSNKISTVPFQPGVFVLCVCVYVYVCVCVCVHVCAL